MYNTQLKKQIITLRQNNKSVNEIAEQTGISVINLRKWLSSHKIYKRNNKLKIINELSDTELAYIAGIIDGEGSIVISKSKSDEYQLSMKVVNTDKNLIEWLSQKTLQPFFTDKLRTDRPNSRQTYSIHWPVQVTLYLLDKIYPYLIIKKDQADLAKQFYIDVDKRKQHYETMKQLHKK